MAALAEFKTALVHITTSCKGPFFHGEHLSLVDLAIAPWAVRDFIIRDARGFRRDDVPGWAAWAKALERHQAIQKTTSVSRHAKPIYTVEQNDNKNM